MENLLLIFVRNPELGKVKTRLAKTMGDEKALDVYFKLLKHTHDIAEKSNTDKAVFYSHYIDDYDLWGNNEFHKYIQEGGDLGERMKNAFNLSFKGGYKKVVIIGSDCLELDAAMIDNAFYCLDSSDVVLGPAYDGGYYLLGMKETHPEFFENKVWSKENVFLDTLLDINNKKLSFDLLDTLSDVDYEEDLYREKVHL